MGSDLGHNNNSTGNRKRTLYTLLSSNTCVSHLACLFAGAVCYHAALLLLLQRTSSSCNTSLGTYRGPTYTLPPPSSTTNKGASSSTVGTPQCLVESKFLKVSQHSVRLVADDSHVVSDWLWIDYHDRINVLVEALDQHYRVFHQTKYALEGRWSKALVGGIVEPIKETPQEAAQREVREEMNGMVCRTWTFLGRYRTDVNRGMGWTFTYLATECIVGNATATPTSLDQQQLQQEEVGAADTERQDILTLSLDELKEAVMAGEFLEIQWTATAALALLHILQEK
jgi:ADP-ribose pyrophosphatase